MHRALVTIAGCVLASFACASVVRGGVVETRDGTQLSGSVAIDPSGTLVVVTREGEKRVPLADVKYASISPDADPARPANAPLPAPWTSGDIGSVVAPGSAKCANCVWDLSAAGWGVWMGSDSAHFVSQPLVGDGQIIAFARCVGVATVQMSAGVSIRESLDPKSLHASAMLTPSGQVAMRSRPRPEKEIVPGNTFAKDPSGWVRVARSGDLFTTYQSKDGHFWERVGEQKIAMGEKTFIGLVAASQINSSVGRAQFSSVRVVAGSPDVMPLDRSALPGRGVVLTDGTAHPGKISKLTATELLIIDPAGKEQSFRRDDVAWIIFKPTPADVFVRTLGAKSGMLLQDGDVFEGDLTSVADGKAEGMSLVFGPMSFVIDERLLAASLREPKWSGAHFRLQDGTVHTAASPKIDAGKLSIGAKPIPLDQIREIFQ